MRVVKRAAEGTSVGVCVKKRALNLLIAVVLRRRCVVGLLWGGRLARVLRQVRSMVKTTYTGGRGIAVRVAIGIVSSSLVCHVVSWNVGKTRLGRQLTGGRDDARGRRDSEDGV